VRIDRSRGVRAYHYGGVMSYDLWIADKSFNYTSNVSRLFYDHIPAERTERGGLWELIGLTGKQAIPVLSDAFDRISETVLSCWKDDSVGEPVFCARYDASNGWGSTVGALIFLSQILAACALHPRHKIGGWF